MPIVIPKGAEIQGQDYRPNVGTVVLARQKKKNIWCIRCKKGDRLRKKSKIKRLVKHVSIAKEFIYIEWQGYKYHCLNCNKYFHERFPGLGPWRQYTEAFRKHVVTLHHKGIAQSDLKDMIKIGSATVERWYQDLLKLKSNEFKSYEYPAQIGLDEHRFSKKVGFSTTLCDLSNNRIIDITKGRSSKEVVPKLKQIPGRHRVKMVNIDLSETYRSIAKEVFPNAVIVADRFHVIRLINQHFLDTWKLLDPNGRQNRGLLSLIRRHPQNLKPHQVSRLRLYLDSVPGLAPIYDFKQDLVSLLLIKHQTKKQCKPLIKHLLFAISQLQNSGFPPLVTLGNTLQNWKFELVSMWRFTKSNSITEGFHRKMKLIQRRRSPSQKGALNLR